MTKELSYQQLYYRKNWDILRHKQRLAYSFRKYKQKQINEMLNKNEKRVELFRKQIITDTTDITDITIKEFSPANL